MSPARRVGSAPDGLSRPHRPHDRGVPRRDRRDRPLLRLGRPPSRGRRAVRRGCCRTSGMHAAFDGERIVGGAGVFPFELTVPGGAVLPCAGVTVVGVLPTDRRRGVLRRMMEPQLRARPRGSASRSPSLWASEETIYGRFGYGMASTTLFVEADRHRVRVAPGRARRGAGAADRRRRGARTLPRVYETGRADARPGFLRRTPRLVGDPQARRPARAAARGGPLVRALLERDGRAVGYAALPHRAVRLQGRPTGRRRSA